MPLPVIEDVWQVRFNWTDPGLSRTASCTLHVKDVTAIGPTPAALHAVFDANVTENMWAAVTTDATISTVRYTPLDGVSASGLITTDLSAQWTGSGGTDPILQGAAVISFMTAERGPKKRNRMYLPWIGEINNTAGVIDPTTLASMQTAWNTFRTAMSTSNFPLYAISPTDETAVSVQSVICRPNLKTQRRRALR